MLRGGVLSLGGHTAQHAQMGVPRRGARNTIIVGDSIIANYDSQGPTINTITDNGNGTATIAFASSHNYSVGSPIRVNGAASADLNTQLSTVTAQVNTNPYTVTYTKTSVNSPVTGSPGAFYPNWYDVNGIMGWLVATMGNQMNIIHAAAGGATSTQALNLFNKWLAANPATATDDIIISAGMNDIYASGDTLATIKTNMTALVNKAVLVGSRVYVLLVPPRSNASSGWTAGKQTIHYQTNKWLWNYCISVGAIPIDTWRSQANSTTYINSAAGTPNPATGFAQSDGVHPANVGALAISADLALQMKAAYAGYGAGFAGSYTALQTTNNALSNPTLTGTAGTATAGSGVIVGTVPDSWTVAITSGTPTVTLTSPARTVAANGDAMGNNLQAVFAYSGSGTQIFRVINTSSFHANLTVGEVRRMRWPVSWSGATGMTGCELIVFLTDATTGNVTAEAIAGTSSAITSNFSGVFTTPDITIPTGVTAASVFFRFYFTSGGATIIFGPPSFDTVP